VIVQQHDVLVSQIPLQTRTFVEIERDAFVVVERQIRNHQLRGLVQRQEPLLRRRYGGAVRGMQMHDASCVLAHFVNRRMDREAGRVDGIGGFRHRLTRKINLDQTAGGNLLEHHPVGIDQEMMFGTGDARRNMGEDQVIPAVEGDEPVTGGQIDADRRFGGGRRRRFEWLNLSGHASSPRPVSKIERIKQRGRANCKRRFVAAARRDRAPRRRQLSDKYAIVSRKQRRALNQQSNARKFAARLSVVAAPSH
jgi:hypothetical protein